MDNFRSFDSLMYNEFTVIFQGQSSNISGNCTDQYININPTVLLKKHILMII